MGWMRDEQEQAGVSKQAMSAVSRELWWGRRRCPCGDQGGQEVEDGH